MSEPMTREPQPSAFLRFVSRPVALWAAFVLVHFWLGMLNLYGPGGPLGDVTTVYKFWMDQGFIADYWVGIHSSWVYPIVALVPMIMAHAFGPTLFASTWLSLVMFLDAAAFAAIIGWGRRYSNPMPGWWWLGFLVLLGPIALGRLDSVSMSLGIVGVLLIASRPRLAALILTIATWVKVWPAALIAAMVITVKQRAQVIGVAVGTSVAIIAIALVLGSGLNVFSFITEQTGRGLQIEAPITNPWLWRGLAGFRDSYIYYDTAILTYQVRGDGVDVASAIMTPVLLLALAAIIVLAIFAARNRAGVAELLPALSLALVTAFIVFNKVGSPQYVTWLAVTIVLGLVTYSRGEGRSFRTPAILVMVIALLTQVVYPYFYDQLLSLNVFMLIVLTAKNVLLFVLLGWSIAALCNSARRKRNGQELAGEQVWPFLSRGGAAVADGETVDSAGPLAK